uniref:UFGT6 n=1 Tax=Fagopyrum tataricum TaxID=62330 RepID=A0A385L2G2_FAGTA|nr:UFGT6 [Fagopyrum tataricum]
MNPNRHENLHVIFIPYMAPGHMMPMIDMARLFASHGVRSTVITTPANADRFSRTLYRDSLLGNPIFLETVNFPWEESGLPEGCENLISAPTPEITIKLIRAIEKLQPKIESLVHQINPNCIVSDVLYPWSVDVAEKLQIPRIAFSGSCFFSDCVSKCIKKYRPHQGIESESEEFVVPNLPHDVALTRSQLPDILKKKTDFTELFERLRQAEEKSFGVLINSFYDLEPAYADYFRKDLEVRSWNVGPLSLHNMEVDDKAERGDTASIDAQSCLTWLDSMEPSSVLYVCFGSLTRFSMSQIIEMASALEDSGHPFIWVIGKLLKSEENDSRGDEWWLPQGFEEKIRDSSKGLIIRGWAPQVLILEHQAIGGFLTHCGWNSILEGVCGGVPFITWPMFAEQFYNEKLVTQVLRIGVCVGNLQWKVWATEEGPVIDRAKIREAVSRVMGEAAESEEMRKKAKELRDLARKAVGEGGSSYKDFKALIEEIKSYTVRSRHCQK